MSVRDIFGTDLALLHAPSVYDFRTSVIMHGLVVAIAEPGRALVIRGDIPMGPVPCPYDCTWGRVLREQPDGTTRLLVRERYAYTRRWAPFLLKPVQVISFVMTQRMLRRIKERAERSAPPTAPPQAGQTYAGPACRA